MYTWVETSRGVDAWGEWLVYFILYTCHSPQSCVVSDQVYNYALPYRPHSILSYGWNHCEGLVNVHGLPGMGTRLLPGSDI